MKIQQLKSPLKVFLQNEDAATAIEYCMIGAAMTIAIVAAMPLITTALTAKFSVVGSTFKAF